MLNIDPPSVTAELHPRILTEKLREILPTMKSGESVVIKLASSTVLYHARRLGLSVLCSKSGVPAGHVRVIMR